MNHGIKVIRHTLAESVLVGMQKCPGVLHVLSDKSDEDAIARILCSRLHDDEETSSLAKACHTIHVWPRLGFGNTGPALFPPDQTCVVRRTKALERWNGKPQSAPSPDPCESVST